MRLDDPNIQDLLTLKPGLRTNKVLYDFLLKPRLLGYWTFFEPMHRGTELSDVLVVWGDTAILFEAKTRGVPRPADIGWLREKIGEAVDQLNARVKLLKAGRVVLRNEWRGQLSFDPSLIRDYYGVIVLQADFEPFEWRVVADEEFRRATIPTQVFSLFDLAELLRFVDTAWDFVIYFELRARYGREHRMLVGSELETFGEILGTMHQLWPEPGSDESRKAQEYWLMAANTIFRTRLATAEGYQAWAAGRLIDFAFVPTETRAQVDSAGRPVRSENHEIFVRAIEALAEMTRNRRSEYGRRWVKAAEAAVTEAKLSFRSSYSPSRARGYVFAAWPLGVNPAEEELTALAVQEQSRHNASSCLVLGASAASLVTTFQYLVRLCRGEDVELPEGDLILNPITAYIGPR